MQRSALCRSRRELSNAYFLAKFRFDTAENEPSRKFAASRDTLATPSQAFSATTEAHEEVSRLRDEVHF